MLRGGGVLLLLFMTFPVTPSWGFPQAGGLEGDFLSWGASGRALALGRAYVALATDATAAYWNPAGLAQVDRPELSALHAALWEGTTYDFVGVALPSLAWGHWGAFGALLTSGGAERRDSENSVVAGSFGMTKAGLGLAFGYALFHDFSVGMSVKYIGRWLDSHTSGFLTGDVGIRWAPSLPSGSVVALVVQQAWVGRLGSTEDDLPRVVRLGVALPLPLAQMGVLSGDLEVRPGSKAAGSLQWRVGIETAPLGPLTVRLGLDAWELAGGVGFAPGGMLRDLRLDYGVAKHMDLGLSHRVSLSWQWGESILVERLELAKAAYARALKLLARHGGQVMRAEALEEVRGCLNEVLCYDGGNVGARRLLDRLNGVDAR